MAPAASASMAATTVLVQRLAATRHAAIFSPLPRRPSRSSTWFRRPKESKRPSQLLVKASSSKDSSIDANELFTELKEKWDALDNKSTVLLYGGGAIVGIWFASVVVSAINSLPLLPKLMEFIGLGYTGWFVYRYLLFKSSRKDLASEIEALKKKISGIE